jgi:hypothetical protein
MDEENRKQSWAFESADGNLATFINEIIDYLQENQRNDQEIEDRIRKYLGESELLKEE